jgi:hypothetical protein
MASKNPSTPNKELLQSAGGGTNDVNVRHAHSNTSFAY